VTRSHTSIAIVALAAGACASAARRTPEETLRAYLAAVDKGRIEEAYALTSERYRKEHDRAEFARALASSEGLQGVSRLKKSKSAITVSIELPDGERLELVDEDGAWKFARNPIDFYPQDTPIEALSGFLRALEQGRYERALAFVPSRHRGTVTVEWLKNRMEGEGKGQVRAEIERVRAHLGDPIEIVRDDEARLPLGDQKAARLLREAGVWKVESLE
jgi:hypothetical protein